MVHSSSDNLFILEAVGDVGNIGPVTFKFAVGVAGEVVEDDVVLIWHEDKEVLEATGEGSEVPEGNLQIDLIFQDEIGMVQHQYLLLRSKADDKFLPGCYVGKGVDFLLECQQELFVLGVLQGTVIIAAVEVIVTVLDELIDVVVEVKVVKVDGFVPRQELGLFFLTEFALKYDIVADLPYVVEVWRKWIESEGADGGFEIGIVGILSTEDSRRGPREEAFPLQSPVEPLLHTTLPILELNHHKLTSTETEDELCLKDGD